MQKTTDELHLVRKAQEGDHRAYRDLVERHMREVYDVAHSFVRDHDAAEDIVQEAFVRAYNSIRTFRGEAQFGTWLYRIVVNISLNRVKTERRKAEREIPILSAESIASPQEEPGQRAELQAHLERALHELPTLQRAVVILRHLDGLSTREVSSILQCSEGTVKTHLFRGMEKMRRKLQFLRDEKV
ncbi:MAG: RNA polymerase sigma factor [Bacteroidetes bacterium]|nr:RNA polymerase sigma factor [Bacteroidota bacterium]